MTLRPMTPADADEAVHITSRLAHAHGGPIHRGNPAAIGIKDVTTPDWGDVPDIRTGDDLVFWACGVTAMTALTRAMLPLAITHRPGAMLITDLPGDTPIEPASTFAGRTDR